MNKRQALGFIQQAMSLADIEAGYERDSAYIGDQHWGLTHLLQTSAYFPTEREATVWAAAVLKNLRVETSRAHVSSPMQLTAMAINGEVRFRFLVLISIWFHT